MCLPGKVLLIHTMQCYHIFLSPVVKIRSCRITSATFGEDQRKRIHNDFLKTNGSSSGPYPNHRTIVVQNLYFRYTIFINVIVNPLQPGHAPNRAHFFIPVFLSYYIWSLKGYTPHLYRWQWLLLF
ncbi:hypothetical protein GDO78_008146 [Eleutherodactylus coqui]|uniref:Uncharacterized protein n=1 Tax=Eleutherodactylus coqui TaxID=57060 RepID=A0A8J6FAQ0_ELECQ|nr:hypothetical protein GDO78_008146 [Eleutherodactylus coqui]